MSLPHHTDSPPAQSKWDSRASSVLVDAPEPPIALLEIAEGLEEVLLVEVRPVHRGEPQLRVRGLPQEEVRDAVLASRPDQQVEVRHVRVVQAGGDRIRG